MPGSSVPCSAHGVCPVHHRSDNHCAHGFSEYKCDSCTLMCPDLYEARLAAGRVAENPPADPSWTKRF